MDYTHLKKYCEDHKVELLAVSKTRSVSEIMNLYDQGQRHFGENRIQEWQSKKDLLPDDIKWHIIGHIQTNKVKHLIPGIHLIHSVDSLRLLKSIEQQAKRNENHVSVLLQYKIAEEDSKFGLETGENEELLIYCKSLEFVSIKGVMGMGTFTSDTSQTTSEFKRLVKQFDMLKADHFKSDDFQIKSMGMSGDYKLAIEQGSNMVRIGSLLF